jgi:hypothetical protein
MKSPVPFADDKPACNTFSATSPCVNVLVESGDTLRKTSANTSASSPAAVADIPVADIGIAEANGVATSICTNICPSLIVFTSFPYKFFMDLDRTFVHKSFVNL